MSVEQAQYIYIEFPTEVGGEMNKASKILIIRSARMDLFEKALEFLRDKFEEAKIYVLAQPEVKDDLEKDSRIDEVIIYDRGFFNVFKIGKKLLKRLRVERFDLVVILYNNVEGKGYFHPNLISILIRHKDIFIYDIAESYHNLKILRRFWQQTLKGIIYSLLWPVSGILIVLVLVFLALPLWLLNKIRRCIRFGKKKAGDVQW